MWALHVSKPERGAVVRSSDCFRADHNQIKAHIYDKQSHMN